MSQKFIGTRIKALREAKGLTQEQVGEIVDRTRSLVNQWEAGTARPSVDQLKVMASALDTSLEWLAEGRGTPLGRPPDLESVAEQIVQLQKTVDRLFAEIEALKGAVLWIGAGYKLPKV